MLNWIKSLFCNHKWETIHKRETSVFDEFSTNYDYEHDIPVHKIITYTLRCTKCGDIKVKKFKI